MNEDEKFSVAGAIYGSIVTNFENKTFMTGMSNLINLTSDPERYGKNIVQNMIGSAVPSVSAGVARATDEYIRDARSILDTVKSRIPGLAQTLPIKMTVWGEPIKRPGSPVSRFISPVAISEEKGSSIEREVNRLGVRIGLPSRKIKGEELGQDQYWDMVAKSGSKAKDRLEQAINTPGYQNLTDEQKGKYIKEVVEQFRRDVRARIQLSTK
jgi:hypothetical protein